MKTYRLAHTELVVSRVAYGCAGLTGWNNNPVSAADTAEAARAIHTAHDNGITLFDHADLYAFGKAEAVFGAVLGSSPGLRQKMVIQSKCGQVFPPGWEPGKAIRLDSSGPHIVSAVEGSLRRLRTDYLDILLLHAPSALVRPEEVAWAFDELHQAGKVRYFGVSNHSAAQISLLTKAVRQPIVVNQIHLGLAHADALTDGMEFTLELARGVTKAGRYVGVPGSGTFDYCRLGDIRIQAWSPLRGDSLNLRADAAAPHVVAEKLRELARAKGVTPAAVALAWLLHHPAGIVPIIGASATEHIIENCGADDVTLSDEEWYVLFTAAADLKSRAVSLAG